MLLKRQWLLGLSFACMVMISAQAEAVSLGNLTLKSKPNAPLDAYVEIILDDATLQAKDFQVNLSDVSTYQRLGVSTSPSQAQLKTALHKDGLTATSVRIYSDSALQLKSDEVFLDVLVELRWPSGLVRRAYTLMVADQSKVVVKVADTLSEIASKSLPNFEDASFDQVMIALYRANPQAFAGGSIHRVKEGAELLIPSKAMVKTIPQEEASQIAKAASRAYANGKSDLSLRDSVEALEPATNRLKIGPVSGAEGDAKRRMEELLVQEKALLEAKQRIVELEKNIADLKRMLEAQEKGEKQASLIHENYFGPFILLFFTLSALLVLFQLSKRRARQIVGHVASAVDINPSVSAMDPPIPNNAAKLFAGLDLNLPNLQPATTSLAPNEETLKVKLNLVRAYITIEDYETARKSIDEVLEVSNQVNPDLTIQAKALLAEIDQLEG